MVLSRIEEIILESSTYFIKDKVCELATKLHQIDQTKQLTECYEEAFITIMKQSGYAQDII